MSAGTGPPHPRGLSHARPRGPRRPATLKWETMGNILPSPPGPSTQAGSAPLPAESASQHPRGLLRWRGSTYLLLYLHRGRRNLPPLPVSSSRKAAGDLDEIGPVGVFLHTCGTFFSHSPFTHSVARALSCILTQEASDLSDAIPHEVPASPHRKQRPLRVGTWLLHTAAACPKLRHR